MRAVNVFVTKKYVDVELKNVGDVHTVPEHYHR